MLIGFYHTVSVHHVKFSTNPEKEKKILLNRKKARLFKFSFSTLLKQNDEDMTINKQFVAVGLADTLQNSSARHHVTLRHQSLKNRYHSLLLFCFPKTNAQNTESQDGPNAIQFYCMEAVCPHLGAPLENASIYDVEDEDIEDAVIVCPWHEYDFSLRTGESSTGLKACVYEVQLRDDKVWVQAPSLEEGDDDGAGWDLIEIRPVSEAQTHGREVHARELHSAMQASSLEEKTNINEDDTPLSDPEPLPNTLVEWAALILNTPEPRKKVHYTRLAAKSFRSGQCRMVGGGRWSTEEEEKTIWVRKVSETPPDVPPRLANAKIVRPGQEGKRGKGGSEKSRIAMLHSLANIEQWAIDLAWDIIARAPYLYAISQNKQKSSLPIQFYSDFVKVAEDEAKHFSLLQNRLHQMGAKFGDLPVHHGLWDSATETMHSLEARLSIIHLVHEARGLDANPLTIKKFANAGDEESVEILTVIHLDEVTHVSAGHRWLTYLCDQANPKQEPVKVFRENVRNHFAGKLKGPFNASDRSKAGLSVDWYENLVGEKGGGVIGVERREIPGG